jgi:hypothetical protein
MMTRPNTVLRARARFDRFQCETGRAVDLAESTLMTHTGRKSWKSFGPLGGVNPTCGGRLEVYGF